MFDPYEYHIVDLYYEQFQFFIHRSIILWINAMSCVCPARGPAALRGQNFNIWHYMQTVQLDLFIPVMRIGTVDFCHFIPL